jgi:hypothetical protein
VTNVAVKSSTPGPMTVAYQAVCGQIISESSAGVTVTVTAAETTPPAEPGDDTGQ